MSDSPSRPAGCGSAAAALGLVSLIWGYNWVVMKASLRDASPTDSAAWRFLLGAIVLLPVLRWLGHGIRVPRNEWWLAGLLAVMLTFNFTGTLWGLKLGGTGKVAVLCYTMPFWTVLFARLFLHERMRTRQWVAIALAAVGLVVLVDPLHLGGLAPSLLALLAGCSWGASVVLVKSAQGRARSDLLTLTFWQMLLCALLMFALGQLLHLPPVRWTPLFLATLFYMSVLASALAWILFYFALKRLPAGIASMGTLATPVIGVAAAWLQLGERPSLTEGSGMALICAGLLLLALPPELPRRTPRG
ncbi:MAG: DMT family transporter [Betaproteobacteria bacterium]|nr:EamA family transporter [Rhodocyclaceae bacterium]MCA3135926.1 EamA family transporter [Rhodocyclaceae bacterium]MCA3143582.1 EamA family transporter [Rhodocyclaceae bacterium]MCA3147117.1 EamA family transporter [Rhodocyclaceae bacterium]MCE2898500.1 DMT family transporter [Betaproteobacteria bacterium]